MTTSDIVRRLLDALLPHRTPPRPAVVLRAFEGSGETVYAADVEIVTPGDWERTGETIGEVPISPLWIGEHGEGVYAPPASGQMVVVECLNWDPAFPFISQTYGERYRVSGVSPGDFVITNGRGATITVFGSGAIRVAASSGEIVLTNGGGSDIAVTQGGKLRIKSAAGTLGATLKQLITDLTALTTEGPPSPHVLSTATKTKLQAVDATLAEILE